MPKDPIPVIFDTDIGTDIDDLWALAMLLGCPELEPKLILTACGDTVYRAKLTAKFLQVADRCDIPIGIGISDPEGEQYPLNFQESWLNDFDIETYDGTIYPNGVQAMLEIIRESSVPVTIISVAAVTNLAKALSLEPGFARKCHFVGMHGSINLGYGGKDDPVPETNVRLDVPAFRKLISASWLSKVITPLDTCGRVVLDGSRYQSIRHSQKPALQALLKNYDIWSKEVTWFKVDYVEFQSTTLFDTVAVYLAYNKDFVRLESLKLSVREDGLTYLDPDGIEIQAALDWHNLDAFYDHLLARLL